MTIRSGVTWLVFASFTYLVWAFGADREIVAYAPMYFIATLILPFIFPPLGRWLNLDVEWDRKMFNWFKNKDQRSWGDKFMDLEKAEWAEQAKEDPPKPNKPETSYYCVGITDKNRVSLKIGYDELTMNREGVDNLIKQLEVFRNSLPVPVEEDQE